MKLESPGNFSFKTSAVPKILVFKVRQILQFSQKEVRKVRKKFLKLPKNSICLIFKGFFNFLTCTGLQAEQIFSVNT